MTWTMYLGWLGKSMIVGLVALGIILTAAIVFEVTKKTGGKK